MKCNNVNCKYFIKKDKKLMKGIFDHVFELDSGCKYPYCKLKNKGDMRTNEFKFKRV